MADSWEDWFRGWSSPDTFAHPDSPAGGLGPGYSRMPGPLGIMPSNVPHPGSPAGRHVSWSFELPHFEFEDRLGDVRDAVLKAPHYIPRALREATGLEFQAVIHSILPALLMFVGILGLSTAVGAGVGAAPGAAAGAEAGFDAGVAILNYLGLAFLVVYIGKSLVDGAKMAGSAAKIAWRALDHRDTRKMAVTLAAEEFAYAVGLIFRGILQGVVAFLLAKGSAAAASRVPEPVGKLRSSKLGAGFADWVERNWRSLVENPRLNKGKQSGGGSSEDERVSPTSKSTGTGRGPTTLTREEMLQGLAKDPAHGGVVTPKGLHEAEVGLSSVENGKIPGPIIRDPTGASEFIDAQGTKWDVKGFNSAFPARQGGFELVRDLGKVQDEGAGGENVILDTTKMTAAHVGDLQSGVTASGLDRNVVWYP